MKAVAGVFGTSQQVDRALARLRDAGFGRGQVRVIAGDAGRAYGATPETGVEVPLGTVGGLGVGGVVGAAIGWVVDAAELLTAEIEELLLAGPLGAALDVLEPEVAAGAGIGALAGGLLGAHAGWSVVESAAQAYRARVARGDVVVLVEAADADAARSAEAVLRGAGAERVRSGLADE